MNVEKLLAVVTMWNNGEYTVEALRSLHAHSHPSVEILVVDDASDEAEWRPVLMEINRIHSSGRTIRHWRKDEQLGLTNSWNIALQIARSPGFRKHPCLINNDIIVPDRWDYNLMDALTNNPRAAIVAPMSNQPGHCPPQYIDQVLKISKAEMNDPGRIAEFNTLLRRRVASGQIPRWRSHHYVNGFFMLMRLEAIEDVGYFDPKNRNFGNEDEWCRRARDESPRKWQFVIAQDTHVFHWKKVTVGNLKAFKGNIYPRIDGSVLDASGKVLKEATEPPKPAPTTADEEPSLVQELDRIQKVADARKAKLTVEPPPVF